MLKFPFSMFEPMLAPILSAAIERGFDAFPDGNMKKLAAVVISASSTELKDFAESTGTILDDAAFNKLTIEVGEYLVEKECPNVRHELDKLFIL